MRQRLGNAQARAVAAAPAPRRRGPAPRVRAPRPRAARSSSPPGRRRASSGRGRRRAAFGARIAPSADAVSPPSRAMARASERSAESARCSERAPISSARRRARKARRSPGPQFDEIGDGRRRAETLAQEGEELARVAAVGLDRMSGQLSFVRERAKPRPDGRGEVGRGGQGVGFGGVEGRRHDGQHRAKSLRLYRSSDDDIAPSAARVKARA